MNNCVGVRGAFLATLLAISTLCVIGVVIVIGLDKATSSQDTEISSRLKRKYEKDLPSVFKKTSQKASLRESELGVFQNAAVSADGLPCPQIGSDVLAASGSAADAAIATMFCLGVINSQSMGLGGGFFATFYDRAQKKAYVLDSREVAPGAATQDMFGGNGTLAISGGLAIAVPGEIRGYWELYNKFGGNVAWGDLIQPAIDLCLDGFAVNSHMANALAEKEEEILNEPSMYVYVDPSTGRVYKEGDIIYRADLAKTLQVLQTEPNAIHNGSLTDDLVQDLNNFGSIITKEDLQNYTPKWRDPVSVTIQNGNHTLYSMPPPGSGAILSFILNILDNYFFDPTSLSTDDVTTYQRITESFKYAYAKRTEQGDEDFVDMTELLVNLTSESYAQSVYEKITDDRTFQDPEYYGAVTYNPDDSGTSHLSVLAPNGDAISVTTTINRYFGAVLRSNSTGIVLNDEMDDFSAPNITNSFGIPPSPANFIVPGKRPLSSMNPTVITDSNGDVRLIVGAAGGSQISSATAWVSIMNLWLGKNIKESIDDQRLHHQLFPMQLTYESNFDQDAILALENIGHVTDAMSSFGSVVCGISVENGTIYANSDVRKSGGVAGF